MTEREGQPGPEVLLILGEKLPDGQLIEYFPDLSPSSVRNYLKKTAKKLGPGVLPFSQASIDGGSPQDQGTARAAGGGLKLFTDGASRGNPGEAGAGIMLADGNDRELIATGTYLGLCTNNVAEYQALLLGLIEAKKLGGKDISIFLDSELIVRQLLGQYKVKDEKLKPLFQKAKDLLTNFESFTVKHIPREQNKRADQLANQSIDEHLGKR